MARKSRFQLPGVPQHIVQRGNNREPCFYAGEDYWRYKQDLAEAAKNNQVAIHSYVLMINHVHILATPAKAELVLGRDHFKEKIEEMTKRQTRPGVMGRPRTNEDAGIYYVL